MKPEQLDKLAKFAGARKRRPPLSIAIESVYDFPNGETVDISKWQPHKDLNQCALLEAKIKENGLGSQYIDCFCDVTYNNRETFGDLLELITATAKQRTDVILKVIEENEK